MYRSSFILSLLFCLFSCFGCKAEGFDFSNPQLIVMSNGDKESVVIADYFYFHLNKRIQNKEDLVLTRSDKSISTSSHNIIYFELVPDLSCDYEIINKEGELSIFAKNTDILKWLSYMLIDKMSGFHKVNVSDLSPNYLDFKTSKVNLAFDYRDPHLMPNMNQEISTILFTHNVDRDWGIWGHNLNRVFADAPPTNSLAMVDGKRDDEQFCFSSNETFEGIKSHIIDNYGLSKRVGVRFMIAPNDNDKVCLCSECKRAGNTSKNASPAVVNLLNKLAEEFKLDEFYTIAYRSTESAPSVSLAPNAGVFLSTVDLSKAPVIDEKSVSTKHFVEVLNKWKGKTNRIFLWDYISNFDEYLTPFPVLMRAQEQFLYFQKLGINGLFLNGSGYDYAPFDDVKTYVLSALMIDPSLSVSDLVEKYHQRFYPVTSTILTKYFLGLENHMYKENIDINIYSSFRRVKGSYFNTNTFLRFYDELLQSRSKLKGEEKFRIEKIIAALSYVKLQAQYHEGGLIGSSHDDSSAYLLLQGAKEYEVVNYKESDGSVSTFLKEWENLKKISEPINSLVSIKTKGLSTGQHLEESYLLNDNLKGFPSDFNQGWFLSGEDIQANCEFSKIVSNKVNVKMTFLKNTRHRMLAPSSIEFIYEGKRIGKFSESDLEHHSTYAVLDKNLKVGDSKKLEVRIMKNKEVKKSVIACDEIQLY